MPIVVLGLVDGSHLERIGRELGYHRHADDEYYGGGEWPILAARPTMNRPARDFVDRQQLGL